MLLSIPGLTVQAGQTCVLRRSRLSLWLDPVQEVSDACVDSGLVLHPAFISPTHQAINHMARVLVARQGPPRVTLKQEQTSIAAAHTDKFYNILFANLAGVSPSLQVASTQHGSVQDRAINRRLRALLLVDQQHVGFQQVIGSVLVCGDVTQQRTQRGWPAWTPLKRQTDAPQCTLVLLRNMQKGPCSVTPHPEMVHSIPSGSGASGRHAAFTNCVSLAQTPAAPCSLSSASGRRSDQNQKWNANRFLLLGWY